MYSSALPKIVVVVCEMLCGGCRGVERTTKVDINGSENPINGGCGAS